MPQLEEFFTHGDSEVFCAGPEAPKDFKLNRQAGDGVKESGVMYLHGPKDSGQTSLLLQFGFTQAKAGKNVVLLMYGDAGASQRSAGSETVPLTSCSACNQPVQTGEDSGVWLRINIKYFRNSVELQQFLCSLHVVDKKMSVLLVDGFEKFFTNSGHMGNVYQTLAFLLEAQDYMKATTGTGVAVVTGCTDTFLLQNRSLLRRWCRFLKLVPAVEAPNVFTMSEEVDDDTNVSEDVARMQVRYEFAPDSGIFQLLHVQRRFD